MKDNTAATKEQLQQILQLKESFDRTMTDAACKVNQMHDIFMDIIQNQQKQFQKMEIQVADIASKLNMGRRK